jgi:hypothetical protein
MLIGPSGSPQCDRARALHVRALCSCGGQVLQSNGIGSLGTIDARFDAAIEEVAGTGVPRVLATTLAADGSAPDGACQAHSRDYVDESHLGRRADPR